VANQSQGGEASRRLERQNRQTRAHAERSEDFEKLESSRPELPS
jgi:hypothetical protein